MEPYRVETKPSVLKELRSSQRADVLRIVERIESLAQDPRPAGCEKLVGERNAWRVRVGDYRIVYTISDDDRLVEITRVGPRGDVYRRR